MTSEEREKLKKLKIEARKGEDWKACKALRNAIFDYDRTHKNEPSLALEVAQATKGI